AIRAMLRERVIVDLSHASERALADAFALLDELDPPREAPEIESHVACRFGSVRSNLTDPANERIAERDGVVGLILAEHQAADGLRRPRSLGDSLAILFAHCDRIRALTGSHRHTALGTDLDGFIKPTLPGLEDAGAMASVERALRERYGDADGELIASGNALRLLRSYWRGRVDGPCISHNLLLIYAFGRVARRPRPRRGRPARPAPAPALARRARWGVTGRARR